jgi:subtilisin family serine protease
VPTCTSPAAAAAVPGAGHHDDRVADPWHGLFQWDDDRMDVEQAWRRTTGSRSIAVAVLDTGVEANHKELKGVVDRSLGGNFIPCSDLIALYGLGVIDRKGLRDCRDGDFEGHGTWVASRIAGALNGFASNGVAPGVRIGSYKVLAAGLGGLSTWILSGLVAACSDPRIDIVNMSIEGYMDPADPFTADDYLLFSDAVDYCRANGVAVFGAAGNQHVRVDRVSMDIGGRQLDDVGRVSFGSEGIATASPGSDSLAPYDLRGWLVVPSGVPGVTMVSATANAIGAAPASVPLRWKEHVGARDQLAYYSNFGSRIDLAAPGGARRYEIPGYDGGEGNVLFGSWGSFGALAKHGLICTDPFAGSLFNSACFTCPWRRLRLAAGHVDVDAQCGGSGSARPFVAQGSRRPARRARRPARRHGELARELHGPERRGKHGSGARRDPLRDGFLPRRPVPSDRVCRRVRRGARGRRRCGQALILFLTA